MSKTIEVIVNDEQHVLTDGASLKDLMQQIDCLERKGIAIAVNSSVVAKDSWQHYQLQSGDQVVMVTATQGG